MIWKHCFDSFSPPRNAETKTELSITTCIPTLVFVEREFPQQRTSPSKPCSPHDAKTQDSPEVQLFFFPWSGQGHNSWEFSYPYESSLAETDQNDEGEVEQNLENFITDVDKHFSMLSCLHKDEKGSERLTT